MKLSERLRWWAQNEEMIDGHFLSHGKECNEAADTMERLERELAEARKDCHWGEDSDGYWETSCGNMFSITYGTPAKNDFKFCCYCGGKLIQHEHVEPTDEDAAIDAEKGR